jgi:hypothetical protein
MASSHFKQEQKNRCYTENNLPWYTMLGLDCPDQEVETTAEKILEKPNFKIGSEFQRWFRA